MNRVQQDFDQLVWFKQAAVVMYAWANKLICRDYDRAFVWMLGRFKTITSEDKELVSELFEKVVKAAHFSVTDESKQSSDSLEENGQSHEESGRCSLYSEDKKSESRINKTHLTVINFSEIKSFTNLKALKLSDRSLLTKLPDVVYTLTNLTGLDLKDTRIAEISLQISQLTNLVYLALENTQVSVVPNAVRYLPKLTELYLDNLPHLERALFSDPEGFKKLKVLTLFNSGNEDVLKQDFYVPKTCDIRFEEEENIPYPDSDKTDSSSESES